MLEADIERKFVARCRKHGMLARKYKRPGHRNAPDREVLAGNGYVEFAEFKKLGEQPTEPQKREHRLLRRLGYIVSVIDNLEDALRIADEIADTAKTLSASQF